MPKYWSTTADLATPFSVSEEGACVQYEDIDFVVVYKPPGMKAIDDGTKKKKESLQSFIEKRRPGSKPFLTPITEAPRLVEQNGCSGLRVFTKTEHGKEVGIACRLLSVQARCQQSSSDERVFCRPLLRPSQMVILRQHGPWLL